VSVRPLATSPIAPLLGQRVPVRGPARLLHRCYARVTGRARLRLRRLPAPPDRGGDILAVRPALTPRLSPLMLPGPAA
jgi:hypothetical protein